MGVGGPYRDSGFLTAHEARVRAVANVEVKMQRMFADVMAEINRAVEKGEIYVVINERLTSDTRIRLASLGYTYQPIWDRVWKVSW